MKEFLSQKSVKFAYADISSSMLHLRNFMKLRDNSDSFIEARKMGRVGVPALVVDNTPYLISNVDSIEMLITELDLV